MGVRETRHTRLIPQGHISITSCFHRGIRCGYMVSPSRNRVFPAPTYSKGKFDKAIDLNGEYFDMPIKADQETDSNGLSVAVISKAS